MHEVLDKDTLKSEIPLHFPWQNIARPQKLAWCKSPFNARSTSWKPAANVRLLLRFHAAVSVGREQHALQSLALAVVSVCFFRAVTAACVYGTIVFVWLLVRILTLWVPFLLTNRPPCRKKSILAEVWFDGKRDSMWMLAKWIFIKKAAVCTSFGAIWC